MRSFAEIVAPSTPPKKEDQNNFVVTTCPGSMQDIVLCFRVLRQFWTRRYWHQISMKVAEVNNKTDLSKLHFLSK